MISGHSARVMVGDHLFRQLITLTLLARDIPPANHIFEAHQRTILLKELRWLLKISLTTSLNRGWTNLSSGELFSSKEDYSTIETRVDCGYSSLATYRVSYRLFTVLSFSPYRALSLTERLVVLEIPPAWIQHLRGPSCIQLRATQLLPPGCA